MTRYIFTIIFALALAGNISAQRLIKGQKGFEAVAGILSDKKLFSDDFFIQAAMTVNGKNGAYQMFALEYSKKMYGFESYNIPVETFLGEAGYNFSLLSDWGKNISLNAGLSGVLGYELFNRGEALLSNGAVIQNSDSFVYGAAVRLTIETFLTDHLLFIIQGKAKCVWGTSVERFRPSVGVGLRYMF